MATDVIMPALGVAQQTGILLKWLKAEGQSVSKGEPLMEVETDKATVEIEAAASGTLTQIIAKAGDEVPVGRTIALILAPGEALPTKREAPAAAEVLPLLPKGEGRGEGRSATLTSPLPPAVPPAPVGGRVLASPKAKRIAKEQAIDLSSLRGSGPEGSILAEDVLRAAPDLSPRPQTAPAAQEIIPLTPMRRIVGQRMTQSKQSAPHFYISMDIDMTAVSEARAGWKEKGEISVPSINDFILHASARALKDFPSLNSTFTDQGIKLHADINIGIAVALDEGLVVPVIRHADRLSLTELATQSRELADKAQKKRLFPLDYEGGTFTVSNLGMLGVDSFTAIINPPQCAILAVGRAAPRVVADNGMFAIKPMMTATLSADHRIVDGAIGARFLQEVKRLLERPGN
ncbi:MAG: dihydrolipoamide acetyltransferase family protein [Deltaproteobacteria bacterium]|nr:dihydrolipoamide acetyltransferase family protein [Deltaproteobacteria bacterium]MDZ4341477.1 dihydrolipoamide acetyltransferase family protein [Candidatus Binatia bacterium]